jgi:hypothetical protein
VLAGFDDGPADSLALESSLDFDWAELFEAGLGAERRGTVGSGLGEVVGGAVGSGFGADVGLIVGLGLGGDVGAEVGFFIGSRLGGEVARIQDWIWIGRGHWCRLDLSSDLDSAEKLESFLGS